MTFSREVLRSVYKSERRPLLLTFRSSKTFITGTVATATFTDIFLYGVIIPVVPFALETRAGVPPDRIQYWVSVLLAVFGAALLAASPFCGYFADRIPSRRAPLLVGLLVLAGATALLAVGTSLPLWIIGRVLQGLSSAIVWVSGLALLVDTVGSEDVGQYMGYVGASLSLALLLAPMLGGVVFDSAGYQSVFAMCWGLLALDIVLRVCVIEKKAAVKWLAPQPGEAEKKEEERVENAFIADEENGVTNVNKPLTEQQSAARKTPQGPITATNTSIATQTNRMDPSTTGSKAKSRRDWLQGTTLYVLLSSPRLLASLYGALIQASLLTAMDSTLPIRVRDLFGWTSLGAGLILLPLTLPSFFGPLVGMWVDRSGPRIPAVLCFALSTPFVILLRLIDHDTFAQKAGLCGLLFGLGVAVSLALPAILAEMSNVVVQLEKERPGVFGPQGAFAQAYGLFNLAFAGGCLVGPVWGGLITSHAGWGTMTWTLGLLSATTCVPVGLLVGGKLWERKHSEHAVSQEQTSRRSPVP